MLFSFKGELRKLEQKAHAADTELRTFKEQLSAILSDGLHGVPADEQAIKDRIKEIASRTRDTSSVYRYCSICVNLPCF